MPRRGRSTPLPVPPAAFQSQGVQPRVIRRDVTVYPCSEVLTGTEHDAQVRAVVVRMIVAAHRKGVEAMGRTVLRAGPDCNEVRPILLRREERPGKVRREPSLVMLPKHLHPLFVHHFQDARVYQVPRNVLGITAAPIRVDFANTIVFFNSMM